MVSYIQTFWLVFSLELHSPRLNVISLLSEFWAPCLPNAIHFGMGTRREFAQTVAQHTRSSDQRRLCTDWTATAVRRLPLPQTCGLNPEELRSHRALPLSRVSLRGLPHLGLAAAPGKCRSRLSGKSEIQGRPGSQPSGSARRSCLSGQVVRLRNMSAARPQRLKKAQEPHVILKYRV